MLWDIYSVCGTCNAKADLAQHKLDSQIYAKTSLP
jgi:hypothetical protein